MTPIHELRYTVLQRARIFFLSRIPYPVSIFSIFFFTDSSSRDKCPRDACGEEGGDGAANPCPQDDPRKVALALGTHGGEDGEADAQRGRVGKAAEGVGSDCDRATRQLLPGNED
jgi:hypothetical protein